MGSVQEFLDAYRYLIYTVLVMLVSLVIFINYWEQIKLWWTCTWMKFPFIGKISKLSKDTDSMDSNNWFSSETTICADFYNYYDKYDKDAKHYERCKSYLSKVDELGRSPFPALMWIIISALVILEALGFAYVLSGFTLPGASESMQREGALGIALIISTILVGFTHWTGHEIYKNSLIKKIRVWFNNNRKDDKPNLERNYKVVLEQNNLDDNEPNYIQLLNRVNTNATVTPNWMISIITAIFIIVIAIGATYVRGQVLEKQLNNEISNVQTNVYAPYPTEIVNTQEKADKKALKERQNSDRKGGWATFIILAVVFVFIQLLGILFGFKWGFVGKESRIAYDDSHHFRTKQEFITYFKKEKDRIAKIAQQYLQNLQHTMSRYASLNGTSAKQLELIKNDDSRTFLNYILMRYNENSEHETRINSIASNNQEYSSLIEKEPVDIVNSTNKNIFCEKCGASIDAEANFCNECGTSISTKKKVPTCPECNTQYEENVKFCSNDGTMLELA